MSKTFSAETLAEAQGGLSGAQINKALRAALADCHDRSDLDTARKVVITVEFTPVGDAGELLGVKTNIKVQGKIPIYEIPTQVFRVETQADNDGAINRVDAVFADPYQDRLLETPTQAPKGAN